MKRSIAVWGLCSLMIACNNNADNTKTSDTTVSSMDTSQPAAAAPATTSMDTTGTMASMTSHEGMMTMKSGKMMVMKNGEWVAMNKTVTCTDSCKVMPNGNVVMKDGMKMKMTEGMMIDTNGHMMDKDGKMMDMMMGHEGGKMDMKMDSTKHASKH